MTMPKSAQLLILTLFVVACVTSCRRDKVATAAHLRRVDAWLNCEECDRGQLDSVVHLGTAVSAALAQVLLNGPPAGRVDSIRTGLSNSYAGLTSYVATHPGLDSLPPAAAYVGPFLSNYDASNRKRAALALGRIKGKIARAALDSAGALPLRADVLQVVRFARDSLIGP